MVDIIQEKLRRFVRESALECENVEEHLRQTVPEAAQEPPLRSFLTGQVFPNKAMTALLLVINAVVRPERWTTAK